MLKKLFVIIAVILINTKNSKSQNLSCTPYFLIPNKFIDNGMMFGDKLIIKNAGPEVNSKDYDYAPTVSIDGKTVYFVSNRKGSIPNPGNKYNYLDSTDFQKKINENGEVVYISDKVGITDLLSVGGSRLKKNYIEVLINYLNNDGYIILNASGKYKFSDCGMDLSKFKKRERNDPRGTSVSYLGKLNNFRKEYFSLIADKNKTLFKIYGSDPKGKDSANIVVLHDKSVNLFEEVIDYSHDFWFFKRNFDDGEYRFSKPKNIDESSLGHLNTEWNEGAPAISSDGKKMYYTFCNSPEGFGSCDIFVSENVDGSWSKPKCLDSNINTRYFDSQPSISPDNRRIYFTSNRKAPHSDSSDLNLWYSDYDPGTGEWGKAVYLDGVNTPGNDESPFIAADGRTLFFSSDGWEPNYGGLDFYVTRYDPETGKWSKPINLGKPLNSAGDDMFITIPATGDIVYFSSDRTDIPGYQGKLDLYTAELKDNVYGCQDNNISQASPNPFENSTKIDFTIYEPDVVKLTIHDVSGRLIRTLYSGFANAGPHAYDWDGRDDKGSGVSPGIYFYNIELGKNNDYYQERKEILLVR